MNVGQRYRVNKGNLFRYAVLALPLAFAGLPIYLLAPDLYVTHLKVSIETIGVGLLILRLLDAFIDPLIGSLLDLYIDNSRKITIVTGALLTGGFLMLFSPPELSVFYTSIWFFVAVFLVTLAFSVLTIIYGTTGAVWSADKIDQTKITGSREAMTLVGLIFAISIPTVLVHYLPVEWAHLLLVGVFVVLLFCCGWFYLGFQSRVLRHQPNGYQAGQLGGIKRSGGETTGNVGYRKRQLWFLYFCYGISALASAVPAVLVVFFVRDYLGSSSFIGLALTIYFLSGALSMPFWQWLAKRIGKIRAWQCSMVIAVLSFSWVLLLAPGDLSVYGLICLFSGFALGAEMALPPSILAETIQQSPDKSAALKYSGLSFISKVSLSIAAGVCLPLLGMLGFEPGTDSGSSSAVYLLYMYGALPGALKLIALALTQCWIYSEYTGVNDVSHKNYSNFGSLSDG